MDGLLEDLLARSAAGDRAAFAQLYERTAPKLMGIARRILGDTAAAEEAVQDSYVRIWQNAGGYDALRGAALTWMAAIARNRAIDMVRSSPARMQRREASIDDAAGDIGSLAAFAEGSDPLTRRALAACLGELDTGHREAVLLAYCNGYSRDELAQRLGHPVGTIKSWLHRALATLRTCMTRHG